MRRKVTSAKVYVKKQHQTKALSFRLKAAPFTSRSRTGTDVSAAACATLHLTDRRLRRPASEESATRDGPAPSGPARPAARGDHRHDRRDLGAVPAGVVASPPRRRPLGAQQGDGRAGRARPGRRAGRGAPPCPPGTGGGARHGAPPRRGEPGERPVAARPPAPARHRRRLRRRGTRLRPGRRGRVARGGTCARSGRATCSAWLCCSPGRSSRPCSAVLAAPRSTRVRAWVGYGVLVPLSTIGTGIAPSVTATLVGLVVVPPAVVLLALSGRDVRAVGPFLAVPVLVTATGLLLYPSTALWAVRFGTSPEVGTALAVLAAGALGVAFTAHLVRSARQYARKRAGDQTVTISHWWLLATVWHSVVLIPSGIRPALAIWTAHLAFRLVLAAAMRLRPRPDRPAPPAAAPAHTRRPAVQRHPSLPARRVLALRRHHRDDHEDGPRVRRARAARVPRPAPRQAGPSDRRHRRGVAHAGRRPRRGSGPRRAVPRRRAVLP